MVFFKALSLTKNLLDLYSIKKSLKYAYNDFWFDQIFNNEKM